VAYNIADLLEHAVELMPERVAVVCGQRRRTFGELEHRANRVAHYFAGQGITAGAHVGIYSRNSVEYVETMVALFKLRAVPININYRYTAEELAYLFDDADLQGLVHERQYAELVAQARTPEMKHLVVVEDGSATDYGGVEYEQALAQGSAERDFGRRSSDDVYVIYTGGTTGMPKGVVWRQEDVWRVLGGGIDFRTGTPVLDEGEPATLGQQAAAVGVLPGRPADARRRSVGCAGRLVRGRNRGTHPEVRRSGDLADDRAGESDPGLDRGRRHGAADDRGLPSPRARRLLAGGTDEQCGRVLPFGEAAVPGCLSRAGDPRRRRFFGDRIDRHRWRGSRW